MSALLLACAVVQSAPLESSTEMQYLPPVESPPVESPPEISSYEYTPTDTGYTYRWDICGINQTYILNWIWCNILWFSLHLSNSITRDETFEIKNKGTPEEEIVVTGEYVFKGDDGYRYYIKYSIDADGTHVTVDSTAIHRIPPSALKSLVGWTEIQL